LIAVPPRTRRDRGSLMDEASGFSCSPGPPGSEKERRAWVQGPVRSSAQSALVTSLLTSATTFEDPPSLLRFPPQPPYRFAPCVSLFVVFLCRRNRVETHSPSRMSSTAEKPPGGAPTADAFCCLRGLAGWLRSRGEAEWLPASETIQTARAAFTRLATPRSGGTILLLAAAPRRVSNAARMTP